MWGQTNMDSSTVTRKYYTLSAIYTLSASLIWGVNTLFLLDAGLDIFQAFVVNAIFSAGMALFEIPTGVWADTRGRRSSILLSALILAAGTFGYAAASRLEDNLLLFGVMSVVMGLGYTFYSGAAEAWLVDALKAQGFDDSLDPVFARASFVSGAAMLVGTVGGGLLGDWNLAAPYVLRGILLLVLFLFTYFAVFDRGFSPHQSRWAALPAEMRALAQASVEYGWNRRSVRLLILVSFLQTGFLFWGFYAWQPYFLDLLGQDAVWVMGVMAALTSLATMTGNMIVEWLTRYCGRRTTLLLWASAVGVAATIGVGLTGSFWLAAAFFLIAMLTEGVITPVRRAYIHQVIPSEQRAAIISFDSMIASGGGILGQTGLGYVSRAASIAAGYVIGGIATGLALPLLFTLRRLGEPADLIFGRAGKADACAAQGIPAVSSLDTTPLDSLALLE